MFNKKNCLKCGKKINKSYEFCPYCGNINEEKEEEDWGILGKNDINKLEKVQNPLFGRITESMLNKMLGSAMKMLEKEMQKGNNQQGENIPKTNVRLMINGKEINFNNNPEKSPKKIKEAKSRIFSEEQNKKFLLLKKEEPKTDIRRFSEKVVYSVEMKGVSSIEDVSVIKMENSIEVRAIAKKKAYFKIIPVNLPMTEYDFSEEKLTIELKA